MHNQKRCRVLRSEFESLSVNLLLVATLLSGWVGNVRGQSGFPAHWQQCGSPNGDGFSYASPYFVDERVGFVFGVGEIAGQPHEFVLPLYRTLNGGQTWMLCDTSTIHGIVNSLFFVSVAHGYGATGSADYGGKSSLGGIFETFDTGYSWRRISPIGSPYYSWARPVTTRLAKSPLVAVSQLDNTEPGAASITTDDGVSWVSGTVATSAGPRPMSNYQFSSLVGDNEDFLDAAASGIATTNGGATWSLSTPPKNMMLFSPSGSTYCMPHRRTVLALSNVAGLARNTDFSLTWDTVLTSPLNDQLSEIEGDGCAVYVSGYTNGVNTLSRSTDAGSSWTTFSAPPRLNWGYPSFSVTGSGAVIYLIAYDGTMWKTVDGGDGAMSGIHNAHNISFQKQLPSSTVGNTIYTSMCDSISVNLQLQYTGSCSFGWLDHVHIDWLDSGEYSVRQTHHFPSENKADSAWVTILPAYSGGRQIVVHAIYTNDDRESFDTSFSIILSISTKPGVLAISHGTSIRTLNFGTQALCKPATIKDSIGFAAPSCAHLIVDSVVFHGTGAARGDFAFKSTKGFPLNEIPHYLPISFKPSIADTERGAVVVYYFDGMDHPSDSIGVYGIGVADTRAFGITTDTLHAVIGSAATGEVFMQNTTCGLLSIDSVVLSSGLTLPVASNGLAQLPMAFDVGDNRTLNVRFVPVFTGTVQAGILAHMRFIERGQTTPFDTLIDLNIAVAGSSSVAGSSGKNLFSIKSITPNPASRKILVRYSRAGDEPIDVSLLDMIGHSLLDKVVSGASSVEFDVSTLPEGTYYLRLESAGHIETRPIVVQRK